MFANLVRLALVVELAAWSALGTWLVARQGWSVAAVVALAAAGAMAVRLAFVIVAFGLSWLARSGREPAQQLGFAGTIALVAGEWLAVLANNFLWLPFERAVVGADAPLAPDPRVPVVLVHGYFSNRGTLCALAKALATVGVAPVFVPSLPAVLAPIETFAGHLETVIRQVTQATGQQRVILVCHSMGGLAARACLRAFGTQRVAGLVTLGSPHHGTALAQLGVGRNASQMRLGAEFLGELERSEGGSGPGCEALSIYSVHDNLVSPQDSSCLGWARNAAVHGVGHLAMLTDPRVHRLVLEELARMGARQAS